jgi:hypothetical protein
MFLDKTLQELDGQDWGEPTFQSTLVIECHRLRRVPLKNFTADDLGRLIGQKFSLDYLVPLALMQLIDDPFAGDMYSGDVLDRLLRLPPDFWQGHPDLRQSLKTVIAKALGLIGSQGAPACGVNSAMADRLERAMP